MDIITGILVGLYINNIQKRYMMKQAADNSVEVFKMFDIHTQEDFDKFFHFEKKDK